MIGRSGDAGVAAREWKGRDMRSLGSREPFLERREFIAVVGGALGYAVLGPRLAIARLRDDPGSLLFDASVGPSDQIVALVYRASEGFGLHTMIVEGGSTVLVGERLASVKDSTFWPYRLAPRPGLMPLLLGALNTRYDDVQQEDWTGYTAAERAEILSEPSHPYGLSTPAVSVSAEPAFYDVDHPKGVRVAPVTGLLGASLLTTSPASHVLLLPPSAEGSHLNTLAVVTDGGELEPVDSGLRLIGSAVAFDSEMGVVIAADDEEEGLVVWRMGRGRMEAGPTGSSASSVTLSADGVVTAVRLDDQIAFFRLRVDGWTRVAGRSGTDRLTPVAAVKGRLGSWLAADPDENLSILEFDS
jgi:hypothetical protein